MYLISTAHGRCTSHCPPASASYDLQACALRFNTIAYSQCGGIMMRSVLFIGIFSLLVGHAAADQVTLKNGDRLSGTIVKSDGKTLVLHTDYAGDVTLKFDAVSGLQSSEQLHVELQGGKTTAGTITTSDGKLEIERKLK